MRTQKLGRGIVCSVEYPNLGLFAAVAVAARVMSLHTLENMINGFRVGSILRLLVFKAERLAAFLQKVK